MSHPPQHPADVLYVEKERVASSEENLERNGDAFSPNADVALIIKPDIVTLEAILAANEAVKENQNPNQPEKNFVSKLLQDHTKAASLWRSLPQPDLPIEPIPTDEEDAELGLAKACGLTLVLWQEIQQKAQVIGANPFDYALGEGIISEIQWLRALATLLRAEFVLTPPAPSPPVRAEEAFALRSYNVLPPKGSAVIRRVVLPQRVITPNGTLAIILLKTHKKGDQNSLLLTTQQSFLDKIVIENKKRIVEQAAYALPERFSARKLQKPATFLRLFLGPFLVFFSIIAAYIFFPLYVLLLPPLMLSPFFITAQIAHILAVFSSLERLPHFPVPPPSSLPRFSVLVPLYQEANILKSLVRNLKKLRYPRDRLEIFLLVEEHDQATRIALKQMDLPAFFFVLTVPKGQPQTKPRALNAALPFVRGKYVTVFDAEDEPNPNQLLHAAARFTALPEKVACLQGHLAIHNWKDNFITRRFAIDYAVLFDGVKAGMARLNWAVPLGGSSNYFRTSVLRQIGAWDAWNVTEDADLGLRLALFGWQVADLPSTTWEEAPNTLGAWMNQRTRWMKGWIQTFFTHIREGDLYLKKFGLFRSFVLFSIFSSVLLSSFFMPFLTISLLLRLYDPAPLGSGHFILALGDSTLIFTLALFIFIEIGSSILMLRRRNLLHLWPYIALAPLFSLFLSLATWRALADFIRQPFYWHKTKHGLTKNHKNRL